VRKYGSADAAYDAVSLGAAARVGVPGDIRIQLCTLLLLRAVWNPPAATEERAVLGLLSDSRESDE
jgi:hypothetical protein